MLPKDPYILLSVINTKLRDSYNSLEILCEDLNEEREKIIKALEKIGYTYDSEQNSFKEN